MTEDSATRPTEGPVEEQSTPGAVTGPTPDGAPDPSDASRRLPIALLAVGAILAVVAIAVVALNSSSPTPVSPPGPSAATTGVAPPPASGGPLITSFQVIDDVSCTASPASVPVSWTTHNTSTVKIEIDGQPLNNAPDRPLSGVARLQLPCDGKEHSLVLVAYGSSGQRVSLARQVNTSNVTPPPPSAPTITGFDVLDEVTCTGTTVDVPAAWQTQNTQAVNFSVDGQPLPAAAGFPVSGAGNIPVPCDGNAHKVTLTASGGGSLTSLSRSVNTSASAPTPPVTPPPLPPVTPTT